MNKTARDYIPVGTLVRCTGNGISGRIRPLLDGEDPYCLHFETTLKGKGWYYTADNTVRLNVVFNIVDSTGCLQGTRSSLEEAQKFAAESPPGTRIEELGVVRTFVATTEIVWKEQK